MERKIGETFEFEGKKIEVKAAINGGCDGCILDEKCSRINQAIVGECEGDKREDRMNVIFAEVQEQQDEQPQEQTEQPQEQAEQQTEQPQGLNLCEILKYCPEGEPLWSPMLGDVKLFDINQEAKMVAVELESGDTWDINADGTITFGDVTSPEIMLYPSKAQRDWTKVKYEPKKELPKTWEEFCPQNPIVKLEYFIDDSSCVRKAKSEGGIRSTIETHCRASRQPRHTSHLCSYTSLETHGERDGCQTGRTVVRINMLSQTIKESLGYGIIKLSFVF